MKVSLSKSGCPESVLCSDSKTSEYHVAQNKIMRADLASICFEGFFSLLFKGSTGLYNLLKYKYTTLPGKKKKRPFKLNLKSSLALRTFGGFCGL